MDFNHLQKALYDHGAAAIDRIRSHRPSDSFYGFAFYTSGEFSYAFLTAFSEEGLDKVVSSYRQMPSYADQDVAQLRASLRWSPCDSPLHGFCEEGVGELDEIMNEVSEACPDFDDEDDFADYVSRVESAFLAALERLDAEGRFGTASERDQVVLNVLIGDQSDEDRIRLASRVNPSPVIARLTEELAAVSYD